MASICLQRWRPFFCCYLGLNAVGVRVFSVFAGLVGGDKPIVVMNAGWPHNGTITVKPRGDTGRLPKEKKPTEKMKTVAGMV